MPEFTQSIDAYVRESASLLTDGMSVSDLATITVGGMRLAIELLDRMNMENASKRAEVVSVVAHIFDLYADQCVPLIARPVWWLVRPAVRALCLSIAGGAVDSLVPLVRSAA